MQVETELRPMFSYSFLIILITIVMISIVFILIKYINKKEIEKTIVIPNHKDLSKIKQKYLSKLIELSNDFNSNNITSRKAYQNLSSIIRNFIYEATNIKVQNYTLKEIKKIDIPILYELVSEYYDPEFAKISKGNISLSIEKTKAVIEKWN